MIERSYIEELTKRVYEQRNFIQVVIGPRQVGKTTLINQLLEKATIGNVYESTDAVRNSNAEWIQQVWETARLKMKASGATEFLL